MPSRRLARTAVAVLSFALTLHAAAAADDATPGATFRDCADCPEMVVVPAGEFVMGEPDDNEKADPQARPQHTVTIAKPFAVGKFEITFAQWDACVADGGCGGYRPADWGWGRGPQPAIMISWNDAQAYIDWLNARTNQKYRLLSEAEWEYAARAGSTKAYPWGDRADCQFGNFCAQRNKYDEHPRPVGGYPPNKFGLHDMIGNVVEWVQDCHNRNYEGAPADGSAWIFELCDNRVMRGGGWGSNEGHIRAATRGYGKPTSRGTQSHGFRLARNLSP